MLVAYAVVVSYGFGFAMNLWSWPFALGGGTDLSFVPGDPVIENLQRFTIYVLSTSTWGWDTGRAITNVLLILLLGPALLATLRRASRRASFGAATTFAAPAGSHPGHFPAERLRRP
jgi:energy-coupling factor transport system substrate-specific component